MFDDQISVVVQFFDVSPVSNQETASSSVYLIMFDTFCNFSDACSSSSAKSVGLMPSGVDYSMMYFINPPVFQA